MSNNSWRKRIALFLAMTMILVAVPVNARAATISDLEKEQEEINRKKKEAEAEKKKEQESLNEANAEAEGLADEMDEIQGEMDELEAAITETLLSIDLITEDISQKNNEIDRTTKEYEEAVAVEQQQYNAMKLRVRFMYEKGDYTYMQLLVESKSFSDMMNKAEYIEKLYDYDRKLLLEYQEARDNTLRIKEQLEDELDELESSKLGLQEEQELLDEQMKEAEEKYSDYEDLYVKARSQVSTLKQKVANINSTIKKLQNEANEKQKQIDQAKKEEEERKKREAEAAAAASGSSSGKTYTSSGSSTSSAGKNYAPASSFNSGDRGQDIINYALQFVGNRYVYGGTSLTNGCDCSGFIYTIYRDFGYKIPRTGHRNIGVEVSYENARPGDIICYPGHVALYMGNGQIVHASTAKTGIKIGNATYKSWITIRRVI